MAFQSSKRQQREQELKNHIYKTWGPISAAGRQKYALKKASYGWALQVLAVYSILMVILSALNNNFIFDWISFLSAFVVFSLFGYIQGVFEFNHHEKIYREKYPYKKGGKQKHKN